MPAAPGSALATATSATDTGPSRRISASSAPADSLSPPALQLLTGAGVTAPQASACVTKTFTDFIETAKPEAKRLWPSDCRLLLDSAPAFSWPQPTDRNKAQPWVFVLKDSAGNELLKKAVSSPRTVLAQALANGNYQWQVSYTKTTGATVLSETRRFAVQAASNAGALPLGSDLSSRVTAKAHPRVVPTGSSMSKVASIVKTGELKGAVAGLLREADRALATAIPAVPDVQAKSASATAAQTASYQASIRSAADQEHHFIEALAYAARIDGSKKYLDGAIARLVNLAQWSPTGITSEASQPQANRAIHTALAIGLDLLWDSLNSDQRSIIAASLRPRLADVMASIATLDDTPYASFQNTAVPYALQSLLLCAGMTEFPESVRWLESVWESYLSILDPYGGEDGSSASSVAYRWWDLTDFAPTLAHIRLITDLDMTRRAFVRNYGDFLLAFTAPNIDQMNAFGDGTETNWMYRSYAFDVFRLYATISRKPEHEWYWRVNPANLTPATYIDPRNLMAAGITTPRVTAAAPTRQSWVFPDSGLIAVHNKPADTLRSSFFFRAGREGAYNHSHADANSFVFVSKGKDLLINSGYYDYYMSPHHAAVTRATRYKNAVTFDGGIGQDGADARYNKVSNPLSSMVPNAKLLNQLDTATLAAATGDATSAYRAINPVTGVWSPLLSNAVRSFVYFKDQGVVVLYDWVSSDTERKFEFNYHAPAAFTLKDGDIVANNTGVSACINHYGPAGTFSQTSAWDAAPSNTLPAQNHGRYTLNAASKQAVMVTVIRESCSTVPVSVNLTNTTATVVILGKVLSFNQRQMTLPL